MPSPTGVVCGGGPVPPEASFPQVTESRHFDSYYHLLRLTHSQPRIVSILMSELFFSKINGQHPPALPIIKDNLIHHK
jgi:hypothetical protein